MKKQRLKADSQPYYDTLIKSQFFLFTSMSPESPAAPIAARGCMPDFVFGRGTGAAGVAGTTGADEGEAEG